MKYENIEDLRAQIDQIDEEIVIALSKRLNLVAKLSKYKVTHKISIEDKKREGVMQQQRMFCYQNIHISTLLCGYIEDIFLEIIKKSKDYQLTMRKHDYYDS